MRNCLQTFPSNVCVCVISSVGSLNSEQKRDWRGSKRGLKERRGSQLIETLEKWKNELNSKQQFEGKCLLGLGIQKRRDSGRRNVGGRRKRKFLNIRSQGDERSEGPQEI